MEAGGKCNLLLLLLGCSDLGQNFGSSIKIQIITQIPAQSFTDRDQVGHAASIAKITIVYFDLTLSGHELGAIQGRNETVER